MRGVHPVADDRDLRGIEAIAHAKAVRDILADGGGGISPARKAPTKRRGRKVGVRRGHKARAVPPCKRCDKRGGNARVRVHDVKETFQALKVVEALGV